MGCNIHAHFEIKVGGEWLHWDQPKIRRNYRLFAKMANVRNYYEEDDDFIPPIAYPRGLPADVTKTTLIHSQYWSVDGHSYSWLSSREVKELLEFHKELTIAALGSAWRINFEEWFYLFGNSYDCFWEYRGDYPDFLEDFRLVFWFDN